MQTKSPKRCGAAPYLYCTGQGSKDVEANSGPYDTEEIAVAGILWDFYDSAEINADGTPDDEGVSISYSILWNSIMKKRNFTNYYTDDIAERHVWYVKDLYDALSEDRVAPQADIDSIFKLHKYAYYIEDAQGNKDIVYGAIVDPKNNSNVRY